jgi:hypothetical protein
VSRDRYEVGPTPKAQVAEGCRKWRVTRNRELLTYSDTQYEAVQLVTLLARTRWREQGQTTELFIKGRDGKVRDARTYGNDPRSIKG